MNQSTAIIIAGLVIALSIVLANERQISFKNNAVSRCIKEVQPLMELTQRTPPDDPEKREKWRERAEYEVRAGCIEKVEF